MVRLTEIRKTAYAVLQQYRLTHPTLDDLLGIASDKGYSVLDYSKAPQDSAAETLIRELNLVTFARNNNSFVYRNGDVKLIFLSETMEADAKCYALAHELGHIECGHLKNGAFCSSANMEEEHEANEFAHFLLHPGWRQRAQVVVSSHKIIASVAIILLFLAILSIPVIKHIQITRSYYGEYYVTENGEKYHIVDCPIIKDKSNTHRLTIEEYNSGEYEPCQVCLPTEDSN